jgi:ferredoxin
MGVGKLDLETIAASLSGLGQVRLRAGTCIRGISPWVKCRRCQEACPVNGIDLESGQPVVKECQRCGLCAVACPAGALEDPERTHSFFLARGREIIASAGQVIFTCNRSRADKSGKDIITVPCLGAVAREVIVALAVRGRVIFHFLREQCRACPWGEKGEWIFLLSFDWAQKTLAAMGVSEERLVKTAVPTAVTPGKPAGGKTPEAAAMGRREFFRSLIRGIKIPGTAPSTPPVVATALASRRRAFILQEALREAEPDEGYPAGAVLPLPSLELAGPCYLCNICSRLCPTGALDMEEEVLKYTPASCNYCDLCLAVCPQHSLVRGKNITLSMMAGASSLTLAAGNTYTCQGCGEIFRAGAGVTMCLRCYLARNLAPDVRQAGGGAEQ